MVKAMMLELQTFLVLYLVSLAGVTVGLRGLFYGLDGYDTNAKAILSVFAITFSVFDFFQSFQTSSAAVNIIGVLILVGVLIMVPIILINLIIAQMTNSYQTVKDNAVREWGFSKARLVKQYVRREEKNLLSSVPAPFNILIVLFGVIGYVGNMITINWQKRKEHRQKYEQQQTEDDQIISESLNKPGILNGISCHII
jgi:hypothetical protein